MKTIFKRPLFINPQAYTVIPELYSVDKLLQFDFGENDTYTTKLVYNGRIESTIKKAGEECILHLDLYTIDGSCVLGEWYIKGINSESVVTINKNTLTIVVNNNIKYPGLIAAWSAKGKTNEDADKGVLKDLTGNGHDMILKGFAYSGMSGYGGYEVTFDLFMTIDGAKQSPLKIKLDITENTGHHRYVASATARNLTWNGYYIKYKVIGKSGLFYNYVDESYIPQSICIKPTTTNYAEGVVFLPKCYPINMDSIFGLFISVYEGSYEIEILPNYLDALVFDGVDDMATCESVPDLKGDYTIIIKRKSFKVDYTRLSICATLGNFGEVAFNISDSLSSNQNKIIVNNYSLESFVPLQKQSIIWQTVTSYNCIPIERGDLVPTRGLSFSTYGALFWKGAIYCAYLFNRSLSQSEIKSFVRKYIDPEYLLPNEVMPPNGYFDFTNKNNYTIKDGYVEIKNLLASSEDNQPRFNLYNFSNKQLQLGYYPFDNIKITNDVIVSDNNVYKITKLNTYNNALIYKQLPESKNRTVFCIKVTFNKIPNGVKFYFGLTGIEDTIGNKAVLLKEGYNSIPLFNISNSDSWEGIYAANVSETDLECDIDVEFIPIDPNSLCFDCIDDCGQSPNLTGSHCKTMFLVHKPYTLNTIIYDQRWDTPSIKLVLRKNELAYSSQDGKNNKDIYINGNKPNKTIKSEDVLNKKHLVVATSNGNISDLQLKVTLGCSSFINKGGVYSKMSVDKLLTFDQLLNEEQIKAVIENYGLLEDVDNYEIIK